jgi:hypothetical protein
VRVLRVIGARPEAIEFASVSHEFDRRPSVTNVMWATRQHRALLDQTTEELGVMPRLDPDFTPDGGRTAGDHLCHDQSMMSSLGRLRPDCLCLRRYAVGVRSCLCRLARAGSGRACRGRAAYRRLLRSPAGREQLPVDRRHRGTAPRSDRCSGGRAPLRRGRPGHDRGHGRQRHRTAAPCTCQACN